jgi:N-acetylmuramoyl-L-alanine amidase
MWQEAEDTKGLNTEQVFARTVIGEFSSGGKIGMEQVAMTVLNRKAANKWWGHDERTICLFPWQYSCWNQTPGNTDRQRILAISEESTIYQLAVSIVRSAMQGRLDDVSNGATHYFNHVSLPSHSWPEWYFALPDQTPCAVDEPHWFFNLAKTG